jgi:hypothetical protein
MQSTKPPVTDDQTKKPWQTPQCTRKTWQTPKFTALPLSQTKGGKYEILKEVSTGSVYS